MLTRNTFEPIDGKQSLIEAIRHTPYHKRDLRGKIRLLSILRENVKDKLLLKEFEQIVRIWY